MSAKNFAAIYFKRIYKYLYADWMEKDRIVFEGLRIKDFSLQWNTVKIMRSSGVSQEICHTFQMNFFK